ncbi:MAG: ATP-binding protein [Spirulina sp. SIO3F2]|nr:ATP-binding protein [Spirulina sp. SIO3F2]
MDITMNWQAENFDYLMNAIALVRDHLNSYIAKLQGQTHGSELDSLAKELKAIAQGIAHPPALERICYTFELSRFERLVLLCCAAQALHPDFPELLAIAHRNPELGSTTFQLTLQCFPEAHWSASTEHRPLKKWQLVHWANAPELPRAPMQLDGGILNYLMGEPYSDPMLAGIIIRQESNRSGRQALQPSHTAIIEQLIALFQAAHDPLPLVQLCGTLQEFQQAITIQVSHVLQVPIYTLASDAIPSSRSELQWFIVRLRRWLALEPGILQVQITANLINLGQGPRSLVDVFLTTVNVPLIILTEQRLTLAHPVVMTFDVVGLQYDEQLDLWQAAWHDGEEPDSFANDVLARLASQFRLSDAMIQTVSTAVREEMIDDGNSQGAVSDRLWEFCRLQARPQLEGLAQRLNVRATWDDLILPEREKTMLHQIMIHVRRQAKVYQQWGFADQNQRGLGLTALFAGASGTGKTTAAEILAHELKLDLFRIDLSAVMSKYIGETEKNLRRIFDAAEVGGAILLFDEADALFGKRTQVKDSHDRHANIEVSYLLQRMEAYQGLAILTTNLKDNLDQAFLRRLRFVLNFPYPKPTERSKIWARVFPRATPTHALDVELLGQLDVTGGNIKAIALNAAFIAAEQDEPVKMKHILAAARMEYLKLGRSLTKAETQYWDLS